jgi:trimeric autotransporter adhesin
MKTLLIAISLFISTTVFSQNITNTLGSGGIFTIKDSSTNFWTLTQSTGQVNILKSLRLENTTSSTLGVLFKGTSRFLHNFGNDNIFLGVNSGNFTLTGNTNIGIGLNSLTALTTGNSNTVLGNNSLPSNTTGFNNVAVGSNSLFTNTDGYQNTAIGNGSLRSNTTGFDNIAVGQTTLRNNTTGKGNTAVGFDCLYFNTTGNNNTAVGLQSLYNTTGIQNTALGYFAGSNVTTGSNLTLLGFNAQPTSGTATNEITLGNGSVTSLRCNVTSITSLSDMRDKKNIKDLTLGLDFLMKLKPRQFNWDKREWYDGNKSDGSKMKEVPTAGFIAQELDEVQTTQNADWLNLVLKDNPEKLEATYGNLLPVMVKAIQDLKIENDKLRIKTENADELSVKVESLKTENDNLKSEIESLKSMNEKIVKLEQIVNELTSVKNTSLNKEETNFTFQNKGEKK